jgi:hypothetical protein
VVELIGNYSGSIKYFVAGPANAGYNSSESYITEQLNPFGNGGGNEEGRTSIYYNKISEIYDEYSVSYSVGGTAYTSQNQNC